MRQISQTKAFKRDLKREAKGLRSQIAHNTEHLGRLFARWQTNRHLRQKVTFSNL